MKYSLAYLAYAIMWIAVSAAIIAGIYYTKSSWCLLAFLIPSNISLKLHDETDDK